MPGSIEIITEYVCCAKSGRLGLLNIGVKSKAMRVIAEYDDLELDARIRKIVGKREVGSGYGFGSPVRDHVRDMEWTFRDRKKGLEAIRKLKRAKIFAYEGEEW